MKSLQVIENYWVAHLRSVFKKRSQITELLPLGSDLRPIAANQSEYNVCLQFRARFSREMSDPLLPSLIVSPSIMLFTFPHNQFPIGKYKATFIFPRRKLMFNFVAYKYFLLFVIGLISLFISIFFNLYQYLVPYFSFLFVCSTIIILQVIVSF